MKMESSSCRICHPVVVFQHCWDTTVLCGNVLTGIGIYICQYPDLIIYYIKIGINYGFSETCELCYGSSNILKLWSYQNCSKMVLPGGLIPLCSQHWKRAELGFKVLELEAVVEKEKRLTRILHRSL
ncbi:uncharacterized protein LOC102712171 isoform X4 [Oryza brachyantha]|uniref:uncharacterized protein LOC102712171 isoform X4 n=1 Tax=Oryza brachyantha TaxID=4533 RepID=UPI001ADA38A6|nr:uncharacterized protein LOC102712171 isoform X4 [Oryza brachyantha]XP_040380565.1 uncharacterized protein LOC102712171 isoform X4 [Oryza brachyantha]